MTQWLAEDTPNRRRLNCNIQNLLACVGQTLSATAMKPAGRFTLVLVTAPDLKAARVLSRAALGARLVACANLIPRLESHFWWKGKLERSVEILILFKTTRGNLAALEKLVLEKHPYDTPEIIALPLVSGTSRYLNWISESVP